MDAQRIIEGEFLAALDEVDARRQVGTSAPRSQKLSAARHRMHERTRAKRLAAERAAQVIGPEGWRRVQRRRANQGQRKL